MIRFQRMYHWLFGAGSVVSPTWSVKTSLSAPAPRYGSDTEIDLMSTAGVGGMLGAASEVSVDVRVPVPKQGSGGGTTSDGTLISLHQGLSPEAFTAVSRYQYAVPA